jgi:hypothetical protein
MSEVQERSFFDLYSQGAVPAEAIEDFVGDWHDTGDEETRPLSAYLGMTPEEYSLWVLDPRTLPVILHARRSGQALRDSVAAYAAGLRDRALASDRSALWTLTHWLAAKG